MVRRARYLFVIVLAAAFVTACELLAGIREHEFRLPDEAGVDAGPSCAHVSPPGPPTVAPGFGRSFVFAVDSVDFSGATPANERVGFDLDGVCTCDPLDRTARDGGSSCVLPAAPLVEAGCDLPGGVDNSFAAVFATLVSFPGADRFPALITQSVTCGRQTLLLVVNGYNGAADDDAVTVAPIFSHGIREEHEGGTYPDASCGKASAPWPAKWDGNDRWSVPSGAIEPLTGGDAVVIAPVLHGWVRNWQLVIDNRNDPSAVPIPFFFGDKAVVSTDAVVVARFVPLDAQGVELAGGGTAASFRLVDGVLSGRATAASLLSGLGSFRIRTGIDGGPGDTYVCDDQLKALYSDLKTTACAARDLSFDPNAPADHACDSLSIAVQFTARLAAIGSVFDGVGFDGGGCGQGFTDSCE
jgi:hypothetical protein